MKNKYIVKSEFGIKRFKRYRDLIRWIIPYWPQWLHKLTVLKNENGLFIQGQFRQNNRWPINF
jgi:hypothetical protein